LLENLKVLSMATSYTLPRDRLRVRGVPIGQS